MMPSISVVIPVYNRPDLLRRALHSLTQQTYKNFEVVICDDGSTVDLKSEVLNFIDLLKIKYIRIANFGGPARPRNVAIENSSGEWISFLDSDDWWLPSRMERVVKELDGEADLIYHQLELAGKEYPANKSKVYIGAKIGKDCLLDLLTLGNPIPNSSSIVRRTYLNEIGGISEDKSLIEDFDLWLRMAKNGAMFKFLDQSLGFYWLGDDNISVASQRQIDLLDNTFEKHIIELPSNYICMAEAFQNYSRGIIEQRLGYLKQALNSFVKARKLRTIELKIKRYIKILMLLPQIYLR